MRYEVEITRRAHNDLREIIAWYTERSGSRDIADIWADGFFELVDELTNAPERHPIVREADSLDRDVREVHYGSGRRRTHRIVFEIIDGCVYVLRIRHHAQRDLTPEDLPQ